MNNLSVLEYPFDWSILNRKKKSLKKILEQSSDSFLEKNIAILGGSTTHEVRLLIELFLLKQGIRPIFYESDYNQYYQDALFNDELARFQPDLVYIHTNIKNISYFPVINASVEENASLLEKEKQHWEQIWNSIWERCHCPIIQNNFELPRHRYMGNGSNYVNGGNVLFINQINHYFSLFAQERSYLYINDINYLSSLIGLTKWSDDVLWLNYKYALSFEAMPYLAHSVANIIKSIYGRNKKALALDLDNTLWGGVIGDLGGNGIKIGKETAVAEAYTHFQGYIKQLTAQGILLSIVSKNDMENAQKGLENENMILKKEDFSVIKANWQPKSDNIVEIAHEINIGVDSFVFIDDNPAERELVKRQLPQVAVPNIGNAVEHYMDYIDYSGYFELTSFSQEDAKRQDYYQQNQMREQQKMNFKDYQSYLVSLEMKAEIKPSKEMYLERIYQLINKTNQFNLTTRRYLLSEIEQYHKDENVLLLYGRLQDKFGDNGLISVIIAEHKNHNQELYIPLWIMSCRVLKRQMEYAMLDKLVDYAKSKNIQCIIGEFIASAKNQMVETHYPELGFSYLTKQGNSHFWQLDVNQYTVKNQVIQIN